MHRMFIFVGWKHTLTRCHVGLDTKPSNGRARHRDSIAGRQVIERRTIHVPDLAKALDEFPEAKSIWRLLIFEPSRGRPCFSMARPLGTWAFGDPGFGLSPTRRSRSSRHSRTRRLSPSRTRDSSRSFRIAIAICPPHWNSRPRRARWTLDLLARRQTLSRARVTHAAAARLCGGNDTIIGGWLGIHGCSLLTTAR